MKNKNLFANLDKDVVCFAVTVLILSGVAAVVSAGAFKDTKVQAKKENILDTIKVQRDTITKNKVSIMDLISTKQK